tara:strand:- start:746 stop:1180 length:435 start_codon:yes stop_codon:yes gene_type:complete
MQQNFNLAKMKKVFTNGCFDLLHEGHLDLLEFARSKGDILIVGLNSDSSVRRLKGFKRPVHNEGFRKKLLESIKYVDEVLIFEDITPLELIIKTKPDVLVKGGDYTPESVIGSEEVFSWGGEVLIYPLREKLSTTSIISKIKSL